MKLSRPDAIVDVLDCGTSVSRAAVCRQSQIARFLLCPKLPVHHTSEEGLRYFPLSGRGGGGWVK